MLVLSICAIMSPVSAETGVSLSPANQSVGLGSEIVVNVYVEPDMPISGAQFDLYFDGSVLDVKSVSEGDLFSKTGNTFFDGGTVDNSAGTIIYAHSVILGKDEVTSPGILATIVFKTTGSGQSNLQLANVVVSNSTGAAVPITVGNAVVSISDTSSSGGSTDSAGSGSSGGGGAGDSGEQFGNIEFKDVTERTVNKGMNVSYTFKSPENPIVNVNFTPLKNSGSITTTIEVLNERSALVSDDPEGLVYRNMNIWVGKYGFATPANIEAMTIGFKVESSWMEANGVNSSAIRLNRHSDGKWDILPTMIAGEQDEYVYFESSTPGFSPFAITAVPDSSVISDDVSLEDSASEDYEDQTLDQNLALVLFIVLMVLIAKRGRDT
ncbi:PGF-pre-PGF domain-containing protein [Methanococcoides orientis]|uniref:PGF-pre-PGF domain-containing protein n=1 Tax=Methanococcoides orientis TaxID=2822137 RepID=UPI001E47ECEC|nr:PGF-pre-PGF domain-containing protein [Methanococcoides orientis]UGV41025.1 PGF-pre-PGF domain-containing protein [Methanococcoides orientis]